MTQPRRHVPDQVTMLTRRTSDRRFMLRPDPFINKMLAYETGKAANLREQSIHAVMSMSNHPHFVVTDTNANRSMFMQDTMGGIAKACNHHHERNGHFWGAGDYGDTVLLDQNAVERKLIYTWVNPVEAGLVRRAEDWPGFKILPRHWGEPIEIKKPGKYYGRTSPEVVVFTPQPPPGYEHMSLEEVKEHFESLLKQAEDKLLKLHQKRKFKGAIAVQAVDPFACPKSPSPSGQLNPRFATTNPSLMAKAQALRRDFLDNYETMRQRMLIGKPATFPCGTIQLRRRACIRCHPPDPDEPGLLGAG